MNLNPGVNVPSNPRSARVLFWPSRALDCRLEQAALVTVMGEGAKHSLLLLINRPQPRIAKNVPDLAETLKEFQASQRNGKADSSTVSGAVKAVSELAHSHVDCEGEA